MPQLYVQVLNPGGLKLTVEGAGEMTVLDLKWRVFQQDPAAHPGLQRLTLRLNRARGRLHARGVLRGASWPRRSSR